MTRCNHKRRNGFSISVGDLLAGLVVPALKFRRAIAFSIIAGVDPKGWLYASFCSAVWFAFTEVRLA